MANLWLTGEGEPTLTVGTTSDYYRDTVTNIVYYRENNTSWVSVPAFIPNPDGVGTTWLHGSLPPVPEEGSDGDYYYGDVDSIVYRKTGLDWIAKGSLDFIGVYGVQWGNGLGAPANTAPLNNLPAGSFYLDVESSDIYFKPPSMVWELKGQLGAGAGSTTIVVENELDSDSEVNAASVHLAGLVLQEAKDYADNLTPQGVVLSVNGLFPDEGLISLSYADVGADEAGAAATAEQAAKDYADTLITPAFADNVFRVQDNADATKQLALEVSAVSSGTTKTWTVPNCDINFGRITQTMLVPAGQTVGAGAYIWPSAAITAGVIPRIVMTTGDITIDTDAISSRPVNVRVTNVTSATRTVSLSGTDFPYDALGTPMTSFTLAAGRSAELAFKAGGGPNFKVLEVAKFTSAELRVGDSTTPTKQLAWNVSAISSATTRTWTAPDSDINFGRVVAYKSATASVTVTASPFSRINPSAFADEDIIVEGGTVSLIEFSRTGGTWYNTGSIAGMYRLSPADRLRITYTVAPTVTSIPR